MAVPVSSAKGGPRRRRGSFRVDRPPQPAVSGARPESQPQFPESRRPRGIDREGPRFPVHSASRRSFTSAPSNGSVAHAPRKALHERSVALGPPAAALLAGRPRPRGRGRIPNPEEFAAHLGRIERQRPPAAIARRAVVRGIRSPNAARGFRRPGAAEPRPSSCPWRRHRRRYERPNTHEAGRGFGKDRASERFGDQPLSQPKFGQYGATQHLVVFTNATQILQAAAYAKTGACRSNGANRPRVFPATRTALGTHVQWFRDNSAFILL